MPPALITAEKILQTHELYIVHANPYPVGRRDVQSSEARDRARDLHARGHQIDRPPPTGLNIRIHVGKG